MLGFIGGSGLYEVDGLANTRWEHVESPFGRPSDDILLGELGGEAVAFLPRHGRGHRLSPTQINFRANIDVLKRVGVTQLVSLSAVGSLKEELEPGMFVLVDQFIDRTFARQKTFFEEGLVAHVSMAHPVCARLVESLERALRASRIRHVRGGTYLAMEGPQFSTHAESELYRSWRCDVVGMTNMPEAKLAREAELCYATVAMVTDYDCWHPDHDAVTVDAVIKVLLDNADRARKLVTEVTPALASHSGDCPEGCSRALDNAIITAPSARDPQVVARLKSIAGRVLAD